MSPRRVLPALLCALALLLAGPVVAPATAAGAVTNLVVTRSATDPNDLRATWTGTAPSYTVTISADGRVTTSTATTTALDIPGVSLQTTYRIEVAAGTDKESVVVEPALPGGVLDVYGVPLRRKGIKVTWAAPTRSGIRPVTGYKITVNDTQGKRRYSATTTQTVATFPAVNNRHRLQVTVIPVTSLGEGLRTTVRMGGVAPGVPQGFTAVRDPKSPGKVVLTWQRPSWQGLTALKRYEIKGLNPQKPTQWANVRVAARNRRVSLPLADTFVFEIRTRGRTKASASDAVRVYPHDRAVATDPAKAVSVTATNHTIDVTFYAWIGGPTDDRLVVRAVSADGKTIREAVVPPGQDGVAFPDLAEGQWTVSIYGLDDQSRKQTLRYTRPITVTDQVTPVSSASPGFDAGLLGVFNGTYPIRHLPLVTASTQIKYDGLTSMAVTSTWDLPGSNVAVSTDRNGGVAVQPRQRVDLAVRGRATAAGATWNLGVTFWDAQGRYIGDVRAKRLDGVVGRWVPSTAAFTAPAGAARATPFVEIGGLRRGVTFYVDAIAMRGA